MRETLFYEKQECVREKDEREKCVESGRKKGGHKREDGRIEENFSLHAREEGGEGG